MNIPRSEGRNNEEEAEARKKAWAGGEHGAARSFARARRVVVKIQSIKIQ